MIFAFLLVDFPSFETNSNGKIAPQTQEFTVWWCFLHISSYSQVSHLSIYIGFARKKYDQPKKHPLATGYTLQRSTGFEPSYHSWLQILVKRSPETAVWIKMIKNAQCQLSIHIYNMYIYTIFTSRIYVLHISHLSCIYIYIFYTLW